MQKYYKLRSEFNGAVNVDPSDGLDEVVPEGLAIEVALLIGVHAHVVVEDTEVIDDEAD